jgi:hypothetical protein
LAQCPPPGNGQSEWFYAFTFLLPSFLPSTNLKQGRVRGKQFFCAQIHLEMGNALKEKEEIIGEIL